MGVFEGHAQAPNEILNSPKTGEKGGKKSHGQRRRKKKNHATILAAFGWQKAGGGNQTQ